MSDRAQFRALVNPMSMSKGVLSPLAGSPEWTKVVAEMANRFSDLCGAFEKTRHKVFTVHYGVAVHYEGRGWSCLPYAIELDYEAVARCSQCDGQGFDPPLLRELNCG